MKNKIQLYIANNYEVERLGIQAVVNTTQNIAIIGETNNCNEIMDLVFQFSPDILLFDPGLFGMHFEIRESWLQDICHETIVIIFSNDDHSQHMAKAMECGVLGYINKADSAEYLIQSIYLASEGRVLFTKDQFERAKKWDTEIETLNGSLSKSEHLVINCLTQGMGNREIAEEMHVSIKTIEAYISNILKTLGLKSISEIICWFFFHFPNVLPNNG